MTQSSSPEPAPQTLRLVAIGASAGGLEPLEQFFAAAPEHEGWCFVVIQHLSPDYRSMMDELLGRKSGLTIRHIDDGAKLEPNTLFLNRPNSSVELVGDTFQIRRNESTDTLPRLSIDTFFTSIAERDPANTVAVILSGSGSDGTKGALALRKAGAGVIAQSPQQSAFSSMPMSAIGASAVDRVLPSEEMPAAIAEIFSGMPKSPRAVLEGDDAGAIIFQLLERHYHIDFSDYKPTNVFRRIERRQHLRGIKSVDEFIELLENDRSALDQLYHDLLIGVTEFYRDPDGIATLRRNAIDQMVKAAAEDRHLRIWVPGCASGEEAYTIAIEVSEALEKAGSSRRFRIIATDIHRSSLDVASAGVYSEDSLAKLPKSLLEKYFDRRRGAYQVDASLRQKIIFSVHDVLSDPPFMDLDLISCRNLFIYLNDEPQARVLSMFLFGLRQDGFMFLGPSESLGNFSSEFRTLDGRWRLFQKTTQRRLFDRSVLSGRFRGAPIPYDPPAPRSPERLERPATGNIADIRNRDVLMASYDALLKRYAPSSILITGDGVVQGWFGSAGAFVDTMNNLAEWTVEEILHPDLHFSINVAMEKLRQGQLEGYNRQVTVDFGKDHTQNVSVHFEALEQKTRSRLMLMTITLEDDTSTQPSNLSSAAEPFDQTDVTLVTNRIHELERDLRLTEKTLQHVTERLEASGEELQASNEELQASNEELQASNEELQSSNEELHAVNEELVTVSAEHERKIELLSQLNANTERVLGVMGIGVIFVDADARIKQFSALIADVFSLERHDEDRSMDVIGPRLDFVDLPALVHQVLDTGKLAKEGGQHHGQDIMVEVYPIASRDGAPAGGGALLILHSGSVDGLAATGNSVRAPT